MNQYLYILLAWTLASTAIIADDTTKVVLPDSSVITWGECDDTANLALANGDAIGHVLQLTRGKVVITLFKEMELPASDSAGLEHEFSGILASDANTDQFALLIGKGRGNYEYILSSLSGVVEKRIHLHSELLRVCGQRWSNHNNEQEGTKIEIKIPDTIIVTLKSKTTKILKLAQPKGCGGIFLVHDGNKLDMGDYNHTTRAIPDTRHMDKMKIHGLDYIDYDDFFERNPRPSADTVKPISDTATKPPIATGTTFAPPPAVTNPNQPSKPFVAVEHTTGAGGDASGDQVVAAVPAITDHNSNPLRWVLIIGGIAVLMLLGTAWAIHRSNRMK